MAVEDEGKASAVDEPAIGTGRVQETEASTCRSVSRRHPCPDCRFCQWCSDDRCRLCRGEGNQCAGRKLSIQEQIDLYEKINNQDNDKILPE